MKKLHIFLMVSFLVSSLNMNAMYRDFNSEDEIQDKTELKFSHEVAKAEKKLDALEDRAHENKIGAQERTAIFRARLAKKNGAKNK